MKEESAPADPKNHNASVEKCLRILELFAAGSPRLTLAQIVRQTGYSRTAAYRLLATQERLGWVERHGTQYQLSLRVFRVGAAAASSIHLRQEASRYLSELAATAGETAYLLVPDGERGTCLERIEGSSQVRIMVLEIGQSLPLFAGGGTTAILAHRADLVESISGGAPFALPGGGTLTLDELQEQLAQTRARGYSRSVEDVTPGVAAFGAPIFNIEGRAIAAISIGGLSSTLTAKEEDLSRHLVTAARGISARLGFTEDGAAIEGVSTLPGEFVR